jgi:hypothetical protein
MDRYLRNEFEKIEQRTANTGFASGGLTCKLGALYFYSSKVLVDSFVLRNPPERKAPTRWLQSQLKISHNDKQHEENFRFIPFSHSSILL